jgi:hypothetical protein
MQSPLSGLNCQSGRSQSLGPVLTWEITSTVILWDSVNLCPSVPEMCPRWVTPVDSRKDRRVLERARSGLRVPNTPSQFREVGPDGGVTAAGIFAELARSSACPRISPGFTTSSR